MQEFHYKLGWRVRGQRPGYHESSTQGSGMEFVGHAPLAGSSDPRRIDVRASMANPLGDWLVRLHRSRAAIPVCVLLDLSASMGFVGVQRKLDVVNSFIASAAFSATRTGDAFGLIAADDEVREEVWVPVTHARSAAQLALQRLARVRPSGQAGALLKATQWLPRTRSLVFLVSDFHLPLPQLTEVLDAMSHHEVVPIVVWDAAEGERLPRFGLVDLSDPETGARRTLLMRPSLRQRWLDNMARRRQSLLECFAQARVRPFFLESSFDADALTRYFHGEDTHTR